MNHLLPKRTKVQLDTYWRYETISCLKSKFATSPQTEIMDEKGLWGGKGQSLAALPVKVMRFSS